MITRADANAFIADYTSFTGKAIRYVLASIRRYFLSFLMIVALAVAGSVYWWYRKPAYYESIMACAYNNDRFTRKTYGEMYQKLDMLARQHASRELSALLQLPVAQTASVLKIEAKNMSGSALSEDITGNYQPFYITVQASDRKAFSGLEQALTGYVNRSAYLNEIGAIEVRKINKKMALMQQDLTRIDSTIDSYDLFLRHTTGTTDSTGGFANIKALFAYRDELEDKLTSLGQRLELQQRPSVSVMYGFAPADLPTKGDRKNLWLGILAGIALAGCWAVYRNTASHG